MCAPGWYLPATPIDGIDDVPAPEEAVRQCLGPQFHLVALQSRPEPGLLYKATERRLPPNSSICCSLVNSHRPPGAQQTVPLNLTRSMGSNVEAIAPSHLPTTELFGNCAVIPGIPCMILIHHANHPTLASGVP